MVKSAVANSVHTGFTLSGRLRISPTIFQDEDALRSSKAGPVDAYKQVCSYLILNEVDGYALKRGDELVNMYFKSKLTFPRKLCLSVSM